MVVDVVAVHAQVERISAKQRVLILLEVIRIHHDVVTVDDLDAAMTAVQSTGARFRSEPVAGPGGRQVLVDDPSGNPLELFEAGR